MDIRRLPKNYATIAEVWVDYPNGGQEGDYFYLTNSAYPAAPDNTKHCWNKYAQVWESADRVIDESGRETTTFSDLHVQNDLHVGGRLYAEEVTPMGVGLYATLSSLQAAHPTPKKGMWAIVGDSVPGDIYRCDTEGTWSATGETGGIGELENVLLYSEQSLSEAEKEQARKNIDAYKKPPTGISRTDLARDVQQSLDEIERTADEILEESRRELNDVIRQYSPVSITGDVTNAADEEDLTSANVQGTDVLKFKNKSYNPIVFSGKGRIYLRKNVQEVTENNDTVAKNILTQAMLGETNSIYVVQYDYDLNGQSITIPSGCVLEFNGGSLSNGTIVGQDTIVKGGNYQIFSVGTVKYRGYASTGTSYGYNSKTYGSDMVISGTWKNTYVNPMWVGLHDIDPTQDSSVKLNRFIKLHASGAFISVPKNIYRVYAQIALKKDTPIDFNGSTLKVNDFSDIYDETIDIPDGSVTPEEDIYGLELCYGVIRMYEGCKIENVVLDGNRIINTQRLTKGISGLLIPNSGILSNVTITNSACVGMIGGPRTNFNLKCIKCTFSETGEHGIYNNICSGNLEFEDCLFDNCGNSQELQTERNGHNWSLKCVGGDSGRYPEDVEDITISFNRCCFRYTSDTTYKGLFDFSCFKSIDFNSCVFEFSGAIMTSQNADATGSQGYTLYHFDNCDFKNALNFYRGQEFYCMYNNCKGRIELNPSVVSIDNSFFVLDYKRSDHSAISYTDFLFDEIKIANSTIVAEDNKPHLFDAKKTIVFSHCTIRESEDFDTSSSSSSIMKYGSSVTFLHCRIYRRYLFLVDEHDVDVTLNGCVCIGFKTDSSTYNLLVRYVNSLTVVVNNVLIFCYLCPTFVEPTIEGRTGPVSSEFYRFASLVDTCSYTNQGNHLYNLPSGTCKGASAWDSKSSRFIVWNGSRWIEADGAALRVSRSGTFADKPSKDDIYVGFRYFCTDLQTEESTTDGIEIIHKGNNVWVDALGRNLSWRVTNDLTHITSTGSGSVEVGQGYTATLTAEEGYGLPSTITVTMGDAALTAGEEFTYDNSTGALAILGVSGTGGVTGNLTIVATGVENA